MQREYDLIVVGAGMTGAAIAWGLSKLPLRVLMLDAEDTDLRAAKANFGLVWSAGKGLGDPAYQRLSVEAVSQWPALARELGEESGLTLNFENNGGLEFCLSEEEFSNFSREMSEWIAQMPELSHPVQMLRRSELNARFPDIRLGKDVVGACFGPTDGHVNPLRLLSALHKAFLLRGGFIQNNSRVRQISSLADGGFEVITEHASFRSGQVLLAAGLGNVTLAPMVGLEAPVAPLRGQLLVTERLASFLPLPSGEIRQTAEGTVMIGATHEDVGFDLSTTTAGATRMAARAIKTLPALSGAKIVRQWSALRIMTPDGSPVYASSVTCPGAHLAVCHSGVTLASFHASQYARILASGDTYPDSLSPFHYGRFHVQEA